MIELPIGKPAIMGVINITPDSFSDGGVNFDAENAIKSAHKMVDDGADFIDIGGVSSRPGAEEVDESEEIRRISAVVHAVAKLGIPVSIDTTRPLVARHAIDAGASIVNDITALQNSEMAKLVAESKVTVCLMHMKGNPQTMQLSPHYENVVEEINSFLMSRVNLAKGFGIDQTCIWIDPGIGFGKTTAHNLEILNNTSKFANLGYPLLIGLSRKSFLAKLLNSDPEPDSAKGRLTGTIAANCFVQSQGARILRVHDVKEAREAVNVFSKIQNYKS